MVDEIPPNPHEHLPAWKVRKLLERLKADFPHAPHEALEQAVNQAAALLWPGVKFVALAASASMLVRFSLKEPASLPKPVPDCLRGARDIPPKHAGGSPSLVEGNRQCCREA
jgi:hypothetical protein